MFVLHTTPFFLTEQLTAFDEDQAMVTLFVIPAFTRALDDWPFAVIVTVGTSTVTVVFAGGGGP